MMDADAAVMAATEATKDEQLDTLEKKFEAYASRHATVIYDALMEYENRQSSARDVLHDKLKELMELANQMNNNHKESLLLKETNDKLVTRVDELEKKVVHLAKHIDIGRELARQVDITNSRAANSHTGRQEIQLGPIPTCVTCGNHIYGATCRSCELWPKGVIPTCDKCGSSILGPSACLSCQFWPPRVSESAAARSFSGSLSVSTSVAPDV